MQQDGDLLLVHTSNDLNQLFDVSQPLQLPSPSTLPGRTSTGAHTALADGLLCVSHNDTLEVWGLDDPAQPQRLASFALLEDSYWLAMDDSLLAVRRNPDMLDLYGLQNPANPQLVSTLTGLDGGEIRLEGRTLLAASDSLRVISLQNPALPVEQGAFFNNGYYNLDLELDAARAAVSTIDSLFVYDLSDPWAPELLLSEGTLQNRAFDLHGARIVGTGLGRVRSWVGFANLGLVELGLHWTGDAANGARLAGNHALLALGNAGLATIRLDAPGGPEEALERRDLGPAAIDRWQQKLVVLQSFGGMQLHDITDPAMPQLLGSSEIDGYDLRTAAGHAYVISYASGSDSLSSYDITGAGAPLAIGAIELPPILPVVDMLVISDRLLIMDALGAIIEYDLADPSQLQLLAEWPPTSLGSPSCIDEVDGLGVLGGNGEGLIYARDGAVPQEIALFQVDEGEQIRDCRLDWTVSTSGWPRRAG